MLRDLLLFVLCCLVGVAFVFSQKERKQKRSSQRETYLYQVGAADMLGESARKSLLEGRFKEGLEQDPDTETFALLAEQFLAGEKVSALSHSPKFLARVRGQRLEFFDPKGDKLEPSLQALGKAVTPVEALRVVSPPLQLKFEGDWLVFRDQKGSIMFRSASSKLYGYSSSGPLAVDGQFIKTKDQQWTFRDGKLEP